MLTRIILMLWLVLAYFRLSIHSRRGVSLQITYTVSIGNRPKADSSLKNKDIYCYFLLGALFVHSLVLAYSCFLKDLGRTLTIWTMNIITIATAAEV